jgi:hypothetical protein
MLSTQAPEGASCALHPERPASATCARCGNFTCDECNPDRRGWCPTCRQQSGKAPAREPTPWERRSELGVARALWLTWHQTLFAPEKFWSSVQPDGPTADAFFYGWVLVAMGAVPSALMNLLQFQNLSSQWGALSSQLSELSPAFTRAIEVVSSHPGIFAIVILLATLFFYPLSLLITSALIHLGCLLFGAGKNGFGATLRVVAYASAPVVLAWIPIVGAAAGLYVLTLEVWGIRRVQETTLGRALGGILVLPVVFGCCLFGMAIAAFAAAPVR